MEPIYSTNVASISSPYNMPIETLFFLKIFLRGVSAFTKNRLPISLAT